MMIGKIIQVETIGPDIMGLRVKYHPIQPFFLIQIWLEILKENSQNSPKFPKMPIFKNLCKGHEKVWDQNFHQNTFIDFETSQFAIFMIQSGFPAVW